MLGVLGFKAREILPAGRQCKRTIKKGVRLAWATLIQRTRSTAAFSSNFLRLSVVWPKPRGRPHRKVSGFFMRFQHLQRLLITLNLTFQQPCHCAG